MQKGLVILVAAFCLFTLPLQADPPSNTELSDGPDEYNHVVYRETDSSNEDFVSATHADWIYDALAPTQDLYTSLGFPEPWWSDDDNRWVWFEVMSGYAAAWNSYIKVNTNRSNNQPYEIEHRRLIVHEMFHHVQFSHFDDTNDLFDWGKWTFEGTAKMMEDRLYEDIDNDTSLRYYSEVDNYLGSPNWTLMDTSYSGCLWWTYLSEQFGISPNAFQQTDMDVYRGVDFIDRFFDDVGDADTADGKEVLDDLIRSIDGSMSFEEAWQDFTIANYLKDYSIVIPDVPVYPPVYGYIDDDDAGQEYPVVGQTDVGTISTTAITKTPTVEEWGAKYYQADISSNTQIYGVQVTTDHDASIAVTLINPSNQAVSLYKTFGTEAKQAYYYDRDDPMEKMGVVIAGLDDEVDATAVFVGGKGSIAIQRPTFNDPEFAGLESDPEKFVIRLIVTGPAELGSPSVQGLNYEDFKVTVGAEEATVLYGLDVQGEFWLTVRAPVQAAGGRYDLTVQLGDSGPTDSETLAVDYTVVERAHVLVVDESGSMSDEGKLEAAQNAGLLLVSVIPDDDQLGVVGFADDANTLLPLMTSNIVSRVLGGLAIASLSAGGMTSIGDGLYNAMTELHEKGDPGFLHYITLLSDGKENESRLWSDVKTALVNSATTVNTIGFGSGADTDTLSEIAWSTGGNFYYVDTGTPAASAKRLDRNASQTPQAITDTNALELPNRLANVYSIIEDDVIGNTRLWSEYGTVNETGLTTTIKVNEPDLKNGLLVINWTDTASTVTATLSDPGGNVVTDGVGGAAVEKADTVIIYRLETLPEGSWELSLTSSSGSVQFMGVLSAYNVTGVEATLVFQGKRSERGRDVGANRFLRGLPMPMQVTLIDDSGPVTGAKAVAYVRLPDGSVDELMLFDDGKHSDSQKNDGLYGIVFRRTIFASNSLETQANDPAKTTPASIGGNYTVSVFIDGVSNAGTTFRRELLGAFHIYEYPEQYFTVYHVDDDGDGLPDRWENLWGLDTTIDDTARDSDADGVDNKKEYEQGTIPTDPDTDNGGEGDGSELSHGANPNNYTDDRLPRPSDVSIINTIVDLENLPIPIDGQIGIHYPFSKSYEAVRILRATAPGGPYSVLIEIPKADAKGYYYDATVTMGTQYYYRVIGVGAGGAQSAHSKTVSAIARADATPPTGSIRLNNGAKYTDHLNIHIAIDASADTTEMHVSNTSDFSGIPWQPFNNLITGHPIEPKPWNGVAIVYVELKDSSNNVSHDLMESIVYDPHGDFDGDGTPNVDDSDDDGDGLPDYIEIYTTLTNPYLDDSDGNGVIDGDEDSDGDGLINGEEIGLGTDLMSIDTDGDGYSDPDEVAAGTDPVNSLDYPGVIVRPTPTNTPRPEFPFGHPFKFELLKYYLNQHDGLIGLKGPKNISLSKDGKFLYISREDDNDIAIFKRDPVTGLLEFLDVRGEDSNLYRPGQTVISQDGQRLYTVDEKGYLNTFTRDSNTGDITLKDQFQVIPNTTVKGSSRIAISPDGMFLFAAPVGQERIAIFKHNLTTGKLDFVNMLTVGATNVTIPTRIQDIKMSPDGKVLLVLDASQRSLVAFNFKLATNNLVLNQRIDLSSKITGDESFNWQNIRISPNQSNILLESPLTGELALLNWDASTGKITVGRILRDDILLDSPNTEWDIDGKYLFTLFKAGIGILALDGKGTDVNLLDKITDSTWDNFVNPTAMALSSDGQFLYIATSGDNTIPATLHVIRIERSAVEPETTPTPIRTPIPSDGPDLEISSYSLEGSNTLYAGEVVGDRINVLVTNIGNKASGDFYIAYYLSPDRTIATDDILLLGGRDYFLSLDANESRWTSTVSSLQLPADIPAGLYFIGILIDEMNVVAESNETNNTATITVAVGEQLPDLKVASFKLSGNKTLSPGETIGDRLSAELTNVGNVESGEFNVGVYLSPDPEVTVEDELILGGREYEESLLPADSRMVGFASVMQIPVSIEPGYYYLGLIVDEVNSVAELSETNNVAIIPVSIDVKLPDLVAAGFDPTFGLIASPGDTISDNLFVKVINFGDVNSGEFVVGFYLSDDPVITLEDTLLIGGRIKESSLAPLDDRNIYLTPDMRVPDDMAPGQYYLGVIVDEYNLIPEPDDANNICQTLITISSTTPERTPTPGGIVSPEPKPINLYTFDEENLAAAGFDTVPGGFAAGTPAGDSWVGDVPAEAGSAATDGRGAVIHCRPGEVQLLLGKPLQTGNVPVVIRMAVKANSGQGQLGLAALDGSLDGSIATLIPANTKHLVDSYKQMAIVYEPTSSDTLSVVVQLAVPATASESVTVYLDNIQVIPLTEGTKIGPEFLKLRDFRNNQ